MDNAFILSTDSSALLIGEKKLPISVYLAAYLFA